MPLAATDIPAAPVVTLMAFGVIIAIIGHASRSRTFVVAGLLILFMATGAMFVGAFAAFQGDEPDPRPRCDETVKRCPKKGDPGFQP
ncbi:MAG TPA: hypothetical protein VGW75_11125 [Solirubrobacteraceae bacterium]|nr:hypothetical protein [Solirubrobacteraceae bacterium]